MNDTKNLIVRPSTKSLKVETHVQAGPMQRW